MVGTLLEVGLGRWEPDHVIDILNSKDRSNAGRTMAACGLCLQWVRYPPALFVAPERCSNDSVSHAPSGSPDSDDLG